MIKNFLRKIANNLLEEDIIQWQKDAVYYREENYILTQKLGNNGINPTLQAILDRYLEEIGREDFDLFVRNNMKFKSSSYDQ